MEKILGLKTPCIKFRVMWNSRKSLEHPSNSLEYQTEMLNVGFRNAVPSYGTYILVLIFIPPDYYLCMKILFLMCRLQYLTFLYDSSRNTQDNSSRYLPPNFMNYVKENLTISAIFQH